MAARYTVHSGFLRVVVSGLVLLAHAGCSTAKDADKTESSKPAAASQPASERVLVRIGDKAVVTQADVEQTLRGTPVERRRSAAYEVLANAVTNRLFSLYLDDHPDLVTQADLDKGIEMDVKLAQPQIKSVEDFRRALLATGSSWEDYLFIVRLRAGHSNLAKIGADKAKDESYLRKLFDEHPDYFDGTCVNVRHVLFAVPITATPEQRKARRDQLAQLREDIVSGKKTWEECAKLSSDNTRYNKGILGPTPRYMQLNNAIMKVAWELQPGQTSEVVESGLGYHIIQITERTSGHRDFKDGHTKFEMQAVTQNEPMEHAMAEALKKYPIVGVQPMNMEAIMALPAPATRPAPAAHPRTRPASQPATRPGSIRPAPRATTHPAGRPHPAASAPAGSFGAKPASRPS